MQRFGWGDLGGGISGVCCDGAPACRQFFIESAAGCGCCCSACCCPYSWHATLYRHTHLVHGSLPQMCLNLSSQPGGHNQLTLYKVPEYTINSNLPGSHFGAAVNNYLIDLRAQTSSGITPEMLKPPKSKAF